MHTHVSRKGGPLACIHAMVMTLYRAEHHTALAYSIWSLCVGASVCICVCKASMFLLFTTVRGSCLWS